MNKKIPIFVHDFSFFRLLDIIFLFFLSLLSLFFRARSLPISWSDMVVDA